MSDSTYEPVITANGGESAPERAKHEARYVAEDAKQGAAQVADTVKEETRGVAHDAQRQAKDVYHQVRGEAADQASAQQQRAASGLHSLASELDQMAGGAQERGVASDLAQQAAQRVHSVATWLEAREPGDLVEELRAFARRRPGTFLAGAAAVGLVAGRMTRGLADGSDETPPQPAERLGSASGRTADGTLGAGSLGSSADVPTAGLSTGDQPTTTYTTGSRLDQGPTDAETTPWSGHVGELADSSNTAYPARTVGSDSAFRETSLEADATYGDEGAFVEDATATEEATYETSTAPQTPSEYEGEYRGGRR